MERGSCTQVDREGIYLADMLLLPSPDWSLVMMLLRGTVIAISPSGDQMLPFSSLLRRVLQSDSSMSQLATQGEKCRGGGGEDILNRHVLIAPDARLE